MDIEATCLATKRDGLVEEAWKHFYASELRFDGYRKIPADMVTLGFSRDYILDPFNKVPVSDSPSSGKPAKTEAAIKNWTAQVAESQRYKVMNKPTNMLLVDKISMFLGCALLIELIIFGLAQPWK